jgi:hypothetical protein
MYYSECEKRFLKVSFNNIRDFVATRSRFNKNADMKASLTSKNPPFLQLIHTSIYQRPHGSRWKILTDVPDGSSEHAVPSPSTGRIAVHRSARRHGPAEGRIF